MRKALGILAAIALLSVLMAQPGAARQASDSGTVTTLDGVYTEEQAKRGARVNTRVCSECHEDDEFVGAFIRSWAGASIAALYDDINSLMPEDRPGSLPPQQYTDVIAYILELNGFPPGDVELDIARASLENVIIESPQE